MSTLRFRVGSTIRRTAGPGPLALGLVALVVCGACRAQERQAPGPVRLNIGTALPRTADTNSGISAVIDSLTLEPALITDWNGRAGARAITAWQWFDGGRGLRLTLQPGLTLHDGTPITNELAAGILDYGLRLNEYRLGVSSSVKSVTPDGTQDIVIRTEQPEGFLLSDISTINFTPSGQPNTGSGPFKLVSRDPEIEMQAFPEYRAGRARIDAVRIRQYDTQRAAWAAMMRGEIDLLYDISGAAVEFVEAESTVQTYPVLRSYYSALIFNNRRPPFTNRDVRRALNMAVDRQQIVDLALKRRARPADNPIWPFHWAYPWDLPSFTKDLDAARRLLDANGFVEGHMKGTGGMPSRLTFSCLIPLGDQRMEAIARVLQRQLFALGIDLRVEPLIPAALMGRIASGDFDSVLVEWAALRSLSYVYGFWHSPLPGMNAFPPSTYSGADGPLDALRAATDDAQVTAAVRALRQAFYDDPPAVFLAWAQTYRALDRRFVPPPEEGRDILGSIQRWQVVDRQVASR